MRTKQAIKNVSFSLLLQLVTALSGIIIPRFFIALYGSSVNGLVSSITQFINCMGLVEAGIGAAGTVALYSPLAEGDTNTVSRIVSATRKFYLRSGLIFVGLVALLVLLYPYVVKNEITDQSFIRTMIVVLSLSGIVDYFFLGKYRVLLLADQHGYVISAAQIMGTIVMTIVSVVMMDLECSALMVKAVAAIVYVLRSGIVGLYVKKYYPHVNFHDTPDYSAFDQRWAALLHQVVALIVNNTDVVVLTVMMPKNALAAVSIYTVYNLVSYALQGLMNSVYNALGSGFGEVIACGEQETLRKSFSNYEYVFFMVIFIAYTCMATLMHPFIRLYSSGFTDGVNYLSSTLVVLFTLVGLFQTLRLPGLTIICAAGHYRQTRGRAVVEAVINVVVSIALIRPLGIAGVLLGTCASYLYRTTDVIIYTARNFLPGTLKKTARRILRGVVLSGCLTAVASRIIPMEISGWLGWFLWAMLDGIVVAAVVALVNALLEPQEFRTVWKRIAGRKTKNT